MRIIKYYFILLLMLSFAVGCNKSEFDLQQINQNRGSVQIIGRVMPFTGCDVDTRAGKTFDESSVYSMCLAVFNSNDICKDVKYSEGSNISFTLNKENLSNGDKLYVFANIQNPNLGTGVELSEYLQISSDVKGVDVPTLNINGKYEKCLPMIGSYTIENKTNLPAIVPIPLISTYAKMVFTIIVTPDQKIEGMDPASFTLEGFEVYNLAKTVDFVGGTVASTDDDVQVFEEPIEGVINSSVNNMAQGSRTVSFSFYLPERFLKPNVAAEDYTYPFGKISGLDEDGAKCYPQRYKPLLVNDRENGKGATFVRFYGEFINHQHHNFNVSYDVYVGNDNYGNFDVERNVQYNNNITIKGITASQDETGSQQTISVDHRVDVQRVEPIIINLRRETELDSHFEVRPLRIRKNPSFTGSVEGAEVKVEVEYSTSPGAGNNWIGLERSFGNGITQSTSSIYLVDSELPDVKKNAAGKRKYFTTNLTTETLGTSITDIPITDGGECIWIYVDEAKVASATDAMRSATIKVSYKLHGASTFSEPISYIIRQHELFPVTYTNGTNDPDDDHKYLIEYHEEYLHNYDAEDSYGQTAYEGMKWGLYGAQLSFDNRALFVEDGGIESVTNTVNNIVAAYSPFYDFYLTRDTDNSDAVKHDRAGFDFCKEIINDINNPQRDTETDYTVDILSLGEDPRSAIEYCYNKNKRNAAGQVVYQNDDGTWNFDNLVWFLPAIDEMEEIIMSNYNVNYYTYSKFPDFQAKYYWSSQPAYYHNFVHADRTYRFLLWDTDGDRTGTYMTDNPNFARATKVEYNGKGANNPENYNKIPSGMSGFHSLLTIRWKENTAMQITEGPTKTLVEIKETTVVDWSNNDGSKKTTLMPMSKDLGYLSRDAYARVRCVRKAN